MPGLTPEMSAQLQEYVNASRAPRSGTWANPEAAPLPVAPAPQEIVPVGAAPVAVPPPVVVAPPGDAAALVAPVTPAAPAVAPAPPVDLPAASQAAVPPTTQVAVPPTTQVDAAPRNMAGAQARSNAATAQAADAMRAEGDVRAQGMDADAALFDQQVSEQKQLEAEGKRQRDERQADYDESVNQLKFAQEQNNRLNQITDRRTTTQKVMGVVAQALSSVADGFARMGGNNNTDHAGQMYKQLNEQIERDVQRQKEAIEGRNKDVAMKLTGVGLAKTALGNVEDAVIFESRQKGMRFANELKAQAARTGSDAARAEMLSAAAKLEADAAQKDLMLQERLVEQKMRSRVGGGSGSGGGSATTNIAKLRETIENGGDITPAQAKLAKELGLITKPGAADPKVDALEALEKTGDITAKQQLQLNAIRKGAAGQDDKPDTADQARARMMYTSSARPAAYLQDILTNKKIPPTDETLAAKLGWAPDKWSHDAAIFMQHATSVGNDLLRYESGASISTQETEGLLAKLRSTDPEVREAALQRLIDKRAALGQAFKQRKEEPTGETPAKPARASNKGDGGLVKETKTFPGAVRVRWPQNGIIYNLPPSEAEEMIRSGGVRL